MNFSSFVNFQGLVAQGIVQSFSAFQFEIIKKFYIYLISSFPRISEKKGHSEWIKVYIEKIFSSVSDTISL